MSIIPIVIPAYEPDERLLQLLYEMDERNVAHVILVNDGSGEKFEELFKKAETIIKRLDGVLLVHEVNKGKGKALKTAFEYVLKEIPEAIGVITADSDGQHTVNSIRKMCEMLDRDQQKFILGVRQFDSEDVPWKSKFGNKLTEKIFTYVSGVHVSDTQTGLRGIPKAFMRELLNTKGDRFEFEMRMLLESAGKYEIEEVPIETIYDSKENHQTHFNPVKDSIKIYKILAEKFLTYIFSSFSSSIIDLLLFTLLCYFWKNENTVWYVTLATIVARVVSATYNYIINYKVVFKSAETIGRSSLRYVCLAVIQMLASALLVTGLVKVIEIIPEVVIKMMVDTILFFVSYHIQQKYVF